MNLPGPFTERMQSILKGKELKSFLDSYDETSLQSIRLNPKKQTELFDANPTVSWFNLGKYLIEPKKFITDPLWHAGTYYVQEASSMILGEIFKKLYPEKGPERALDLCAAPGGKSTLLQSLLDEDAVLIANEVIKSRAQILKENHIRMGISENLIITQNDPKRFTSLDGFIDYIQVDAPCSGEGMFRKGSTALNEWSEANCDLCSQRQKRILADIIPALSMDGILVYSTCTFNPAENEEIISWASREFDMESLRFDFNPEWGITEIELNGIYGYYFYPHKVKGEGLFISVMKKNSGQSLQRLSESKKSKEIQSGFLTDSKNISEENNVLRYESLELKSVKEFIGKKLNIIYSGVELGEQKGKNFVPAQALANFHKEFHLFPKLEVDAETALEFLRGNDPKVQADKQGFYLLTFENHDLGWIKFLGNRSNNYYPKPWRIRNY